MIPDFREGELAVPMNETGQTGELKIYAVLALAVLAQATGNVFLSKGMKYVASAGRQADIAFLSAPLDAVTNPMIWIGVALSIVFYVLFTVALSWTDLSFVLPVISAEVVVNVAFADYFLNEPVSAVRWTGVMLIAVGVILVLRSGKQTSGAGDREGASGVQ